MAAPLIGAPYAPDPANGVWRRAGATDIAYGDGPQVEQRLLDIVQATTDLRVLSAEWPRHITDWPSEYHFSPARANLIRPLAFAAADTVLELGCGCGAITRALGETGASVVALEGTLARARVAASRCRDLANVAVAHDTIADFRAPAQFDVVTLIGVLEYARLYFGGDDPVAECLRQAVRHLRPGGRLVVAIENQLGLKYFAGCTEDHLGRPFFGTQDLYGERTPVTFGRRELERRLRDAGLPAVEFMYPFPDYKLPALVLHDAALRDGRLDVGDVLARLPSRDYSGGLFRTFDETLAWQALHRNGLVGDMANSFLAVARRQADVPGTTPGWLAKIYATQRRPEYATATTIRAGAGGLEVDKAPCRTGGATPRPPAPRWGTVPYQPGRLWVTGLYRILADDFSLDRIAAWAKPWLDLLEAGITERGVDALSSRLPGNFLDCTPFNLVQGPQGLHWIDAEWEWDEPLPLHWLILRGLLHSLPDRLLSEHHPGLTYRQYVVEVARRLALVFEPRHFEECIALEDRLQRHVYGIEPRFAADLDAPLGRYLAAYDRARAAAHAVREHALAQAEVERVKATVSWQVTKPLRLAASLFSGRLFRR